MNARDRKRFVDLKILLLDGEGVSCHGMCHSIRKKIKILSIPSPVFFHICDEYPGLGHALPF